MKGREGGGTSGFNIHLSGAKFVVEGRKYIDFGKCFCK